jgi:hypothetical protein
VSFVSPAWTHFKIFLEYDNATEELKKFFPPRKRLKQEAAPGLSLSLEYSLQLGSKLLLRFRPLAWRKKLSSDIEGNGYGN